MQKSETKSKKKVEKKEVEENVLGFMTGTNIPRERKKVAIVGFAPSTMSDVKVLFDDPDFEIWGLNQLYLPFRQLGIAMAEHATRWFQIHNRHTYDNAIRDHKHHDWLASVKFPVYMMKHEPDVPFCVPLPFGDIMNMLGTTYFTNSISWMIALAIIERFEEIHIYGVDMAQDDEYAEQRPSCELFIGIARGMGIKVYIPAKSDLLKTMWIYPIEDHKPMVVKMQSRTEELQHRAAELNAQEQNFCDQRMQILGALEKMRYVKKNFNLTALGNAVDKEVNK